MGAKEQILERFASLSPQIQAAAKYIVDHPNEVVVRSMRTLADSAGIQPATFVRLAQQLGYDGWPALKAAFADELGLGSEGYGQRARNLAARGRDGDLLGELFVAQRRNLDLTEALCAQSLREAVKALKRAKAVHVAGFRASFPVAHALAYGLRLFRHPVQLVDGHGGGLEMQLRAVERNDCVVVVGFAPYSRESVAVAEAAQAAGARLVALTDSNASPLALLADVPVLFSPASPSFFPSVAAAVAVVEALLELLVADAGEAASQQIDRAEQQLFDSGAYVQSPVRRNPAKP